jgi:hypothetical protein
MFLVDTHTFTPQKLSIQLLSCGTSKLSQVPIVLISKQGFSWGFVMNFVGSKRRKQLFYDSDWLID